MPWGGGAVAEYVAWLERDPSALAHELATWGRSPGAFHARLREIHSDTLRRRFVRLLGRSATPDQAVVIERQLQAYGAAWEIAFRLERFGARGPAPAFDRSAYERNLVSRDPSAPFTGSGMTGVPESEHTIPLADKLDLLLNDEEVKQRYKNPGGLGLDPELVTQAAHLLLRQPIVTSFPEAYGAARPSRAQVIRAAAAQHRLSPALVAAFILAEQTDQSSNEDAAEYQAATNPVLKADTSIGLGQVLVSTARKQDLFADLLGPQTRGRLSHTDAARLLASEEANIFAVARVLRQIADAGATKRPEQLPRTYAELASLKRPPLDLARYAEHSDRWSSSHVVVLGSEYTSKAWDDNLVVGWGDNVLAAMERVIASGVFADSRLAPNTPSPALSLSSQGGEVFASYSRDNLDRITAIYNKPELPIQTRMQALVDYRDVALTNLPWATALKIAKAAPDMPIHGGARPGVYRPLYEQLVRDPVLQQLVADTARRILATPDAKLDIAVIWEGTKARALQLMPHAESLEDVVLAAVRAMATICNYYKVHEGVDDDLLKTIDGPAAKVPNLWQNILAAGKALNDSSSPNAAILSHGNAAGREHATNFCHDNTIHFFSHAALTLGLIHDHGLSEADALAVSAFAGAHYEVTDPWRMNENSGNDGLHDVQINSEGAGFGAALHRNPRAALPSRDGALQPEDRTIPTADKPADMDYLAGVARDAGDLGPGSLLRHYRRGLKLRAQDRANAAARLKSLPQSPYDEQKNPYAKAKNS